MTPVETERRAFLEKYRLAPDAFEKSGVTWADLMGIKAAYEGLRVRLQPTASYVAQLIGQVPEAHSLKVRIKDVEHLLAKVVRKRLDRPERVIDVGNYREVITDLVGVRVLHLFKREWEPIHDFIKKTWELHETPVANHRDGDPESLLKAFTERGCELRQHPAGYRSVHYVVRSRLDREEILVEVQVRTIFEEGWSEIDHRVRYPYELDNEVLAAFLGIFNRLAGNADEMGGFILYLRSELLARDERYEASRRELEQNLKALKKLTKELKVSEEQRLELQEQISAAERFPSVLSSFGGPSLSVDLSGVDLARAGGLPSLLSTVPSAGIQFLRADLQDAARLGYEGGRLSFGWDPTKDKKP